MNATLEFNISHYPEPVLRLLLASAQRWNCTPAEAETKILEQRARKEGFFATPTEKKPSARPSRPSPFTA